MLYQHWTVMGTRDSAYIGEQCLLTGPDCLEETAHDEFQVQDGQSPGLFGLVSGFEGTYLVSCHTPHT